MTCTRAEEQRILRRIEERIEERNDGDLTMKILTVERLQDFPFEEYMNIQEVADVIGFTASSIRNHFQLVARGLYSKYATCRSLPSPVRVRCMFIGGQPRMMFRRADIEAWVKAHGKRGKRGK